MKTILIGLMAVVIYAVLIFATIKAHAEHEKTRREIEELWREHARDQN